MAGRAFRNHHSGRLTKLPKAIQEISMAMRLTLHPRYQRLKTKQRWIWQRRISTTWTVRSLELYAYLTLDNPTDHALFQLSTWPSELRSAILHHGPCRSNELFTINSENGNRCIFSGENITMHILGLWKSDDNGSASHHRWGSHYCQSVEIEWQWLCFSPPMRSHIVKAVACSAIHRQCKTSGPTMCRTTRITSK